MQAAVPLVTAYNTPLSAPFLCLVELSDAISRADQEDSESDRRTASRKGEGEA